MAKKTAANAAPQKTASDWAEVVDWFKRNIDALPASLSLDEGFNIPDLPHTVRLYFDLVDRHAEHRGFAGQLNHLVRIREKLLADGFVAK